jgi:hypothetical protein
MVRGNTNHGHLAKLLGPKGLLRNKQLQPISLGSSYFTILCGPPIVCGPLLPEIFFTTAPSGNPANSFYQYDR